MDQNQYLKHSLVYRGPAGALSPPDKEEATSVIFSTERMQHGDHPKRGAFLFGVRHAGGKSDIELLVSEEDWETIISLLAKSSPRLREMIKRVVSEIV